MSAREVNIDPVCHRPEVPQEIQRAFDQSLYKKHLMNEQHGEFLLAPDFFVKNGEFFLDLTIKSCKLQSQETLSYQYKNGAWALVPIGA